MVKTELLFKLRNATEDAKKVHADLSCSLGFYFGYPNCCINEFCNDILHDKDSSERNINGLGFIPCRKHFIEISLSKININDLIKNRVCQTPYLAGEELHPK